MGQKESGAIEVTIGETKEAYMSINQSVQSVQSLSRVQLCATPQTAAHQAPPSLGFSRQEHWSGLPVPSPMHASKKWSEVAQLYPALSDPMDCSLPGSSIHGIFQARVLEWGAIAFSVHEHNMANKSWGVLHASHYALQNFKVGCHIHQDREI